MQAIFQFLNELKQHNNRPWFQEHKEEFLRCQSLFFDKIDQLIAAIARFDSSVSHLQAKDCCYRIYRDVRFSADKSPYKTHFAAYINPGGKKSGYSGYYLHISTSEPDKDYPHSCFLAAGDYMCPPEVLKILREDIVAGQGDFDKIVKASSDFYLERTYALKRMPKGFSEDEPYADYLKLKNFCLIHPFNIEEALSDDFIARMAELCHQAQPFLQYINRAIEYSKE